jgi:hypothetical protein
MSYKNPRINDFKMSGSDVIRKLSGGNPGAITVCARLVEYGPKIDPKSMFGGLGALLMLDSMDIYDENIWMFYKDVCGEDLGVMLAVMKAYQLAQLEGCTLAAIHHAIHNHGVGLNTKKIVAAVQARLPEFRVDAGKAV